MSVVRRLRATLSLCLLFTSSGFCQQAESSATSASAQTAAAPQPAPQSLADMARKLRKDKTADVKMSAEEGK